MGKCELIGMREAWWVWLGEQPAVRLDTEADASTLMLENGREYGIMNNYNRCDQASPVVELIWNSVLPAGQSHHKTVCSPAVYVLHDGELRKMIRPLTPSKLEAATKGWKALEPKFPAWWAQQYHDSINDPDTLIVRGSKPLVIQLAARWPNR